MHELTFDFRGGLVSARCACGGWEGQAPAGSGGIASTAVAVDRLERGHRRHLLAQAPAPAARPPPGVAT
jgi:hypothetical protein